MIFDILLKIYETDTIKELKEKMTASFCQEYRMSAIHDINIHNGKLYGEVPEYNRDNFIDAYVEKIAEVALDEKNIDSLSKDKLDDVFVKKITCSLICAVINYQDGTLLSEGLSLMDKAASEGVVKAIEMLTGREDSKQYENNLLLSMKYANNAWKKSASERLVHLIFTAVMMNQTNCAKEEIKQFVELSCTAVSNYFEAFLLREYECEMDAEKIMYAEKDQLVKKNANEIAEIGFAKYKEA